MEKGLRQVKVKRNAVYNTKYDYLGKPNSGSGGEAVDENGQVIQGDTGFMSELHDTIAEYVEKQVSKQPVPTVQSVANSAQEKLEEAIRDVIEEIYGDSLEQTSQAQQDREAEQEEQKMDEELKQEQQEQKEEQEQPDKAPQNEQNDTESDEKPKDEYTCTKSERQFLDAFMALQEAGSLLGLCPTTRVINGSTTRNVKMVPSINEERPSDLVYIQEVRQEQAVYEIMDKHIKDMFTGVENMLTDKGI